MNDTLTVIIAIGVAAILMFVFPLMTISDRNDDVAQLTVETATIEFVDNIRTTGKITKANYDSFMESITATGNTYIIEIELKKKDTNLGKKTAQATADKIGENAYVAIYDSQIEEVLERDGEYICKEGDIISVSAKNDSQTVSQQLKNFFYTVTGNDAYTIAAEHAGIITANGK